MIRTSHPRPLLLALALIVGAASVPPCRLMAAEPEAAATAVTLPNVDAPQQELHGTFAGQRFWARLTPADKQFGNNRVMQLVYTPPIAAELGGAHLSDCPFLLVDPHMRVVAWNGRDSGSKAVPAAPSGYAITRETTIGDGVDKRIDLVARTLAGERGWDLRIAPVLLAIGWRPTGTASVRVVDLFGPRSAESMTLTWNDTAVTIAGIMYTVVADEAGRLKSLNAADGSAVLTVAGRL